MAKLTLNDISTFVNDSSAVTSTNANYALIEAAMEKTLSRDGTSPNTMSADFDMNSNDILNVGTISVQDLELDGVSIQDKVDEAVASAAAALVSENNAEAAEAAAEAAQAAAVAAQAAAEAARDEAEEIVGGPYVTGVTAADASIVIAGTATAPTITVGEIQTADIANDAVTFAKMQDIATNSLIGRDTASSGSPENILLDDTLEMDGSGNLQRAALSGDITAPAGSNVTTLATVNSNVGSFTAANITVNAKGLITAAASGTSGGYTALTPYTTPGSGQTQRGWTGIPSTVTSIIIRWTGFSWSSAAHGYVRIGDSGGLETSGYDLRYTKIILSGPVVTNEVSTGDSGLAMNNLTSVGAEVYSGYARFDLIDPATNLWGFEFQIDETAATPQSLIGYGTKTLSGTLDRISLVVSGFTIDALTFANAYYK